MSAPRDPWAATVLTLFPEMFPGPLGHSLAGRALEQGIWTLRTLNLRDFASDRHHSVDDLPFGGGAGMVMRPDVVARALDAAAAAGPARPVLYLSARGVPLTQRRVEQLAGGPGVVVLCGRFEGVDQRVVEARALEEVSLGDVVLSGGEPAAMALLDACVRLLPGVLGPAGLVGRGELRPGPARVPAIHATPGLGRACGAGRAPVRAPRADSDVAPAAGRARDPDPPPRPLGTSSRRRRARPHRRAVVSGR